MGMQRTTSVIIVREWEQQTSGSGCCGRIEGDFAMCGDERVFAERRAVMEGMGPVYRTLRARFGDAVDVQIVDPRNVSLILLLLRDFRAFHVGFGAAVRTLFRLPKQGVVVNGRLVDRSARPDPERVASAVARTLPGGVAAPAR
jgi:hypothetical protein